MKLTSYLGYDIYVDEETGKFSAYVDWYGTLENRALSQLKNEMAQTAPTIKLQSVVAEGARWGDAFFASDIKSVAGAERNEKGESWWYGPKETGRGQKYTEYRRLDTVYEDAPSIVERLTIIQKKVRQKKFEIDEQARKDVQDVLAEYTPITVERVQELIEAERKRRHGG